MGTGYRPPVKCTRTREHNETRMRMETDNPDGLSACHSHGEIVILARSILFNGISLDSAFTSLAVAVYPTV